MPHERLQEFAVIDYTREMVILALIAGEGKEEILGIAQYGIDDVTHTGEVGVVVRDDFAGPGCRHRAAVLSHLSGQAAGLCWDLPQRCSLKTGP